MRNIPLDKPMTKGVRTVETNLSFKEIKFEEVMDRELAVAYTKNCSGGRSDCCTRTCKPKDEQQDWGKYLQVYGGAIQY
jgi:hypothetical protein